MIELKPKTWDEAKEEFKKCIKNERWVFRGQENSEWGLKTSLERWIISNKSLSKSVFDAEFAEEIFFDKFRDGAVRYLRSSLELPKNRLEWWALMQHFGTPTRLLDFTMSPYVATFFAFESAGKSKNCYVVWAVNETWCSTTAVAIFNEAHKGEKEFVALHEYTDLSREEYFEKIFITDPKIPQMVFPVCSEHRNERLTIQQGLFLCPGSANDSFEEHLENMDNSHDNLKKIIMPNEWREEVIKDLQLINITSATLFPGLDGFARSLRDYIFKRH